MYSLLKLFSRLPFPVLYLFADFVAWLMRSVVRYRRGVITENLKSSFPEKSGKEISRIRGEYYTFLADYFVETLKLASISRKEMEARFKVEGVELINEAMRGGQSCSLLLAHYCNWEWASSLPLHFNPGAASAQIYHPLENKTANQIFLRLRSRWNAVSVPMADTLRVLLGWKRDGIPSVTGYIADQAPGLNGIHLFLDFLNHDTPVYTGPERISKALKAGVFYAHISRPQRGRYICRIIPISGNAASEDTFSITRRYYELLEQQICEAPQFWLWSHRRWKRTRQMFEQEYGEEAAERLTHL